MTRNFYPRFGKRCFDAALSFTGLVLLSPLLLVVAIAVRLTSPGPALFSQVRTGRLGKPFRILKFRTMRTSPAATGSLLTASGDPRVTPLGRWLRKTKVDELPQLFNVLVGEMSFVGPRPEVPIYTAKYDRRQRQVLLVRPGITSPHIEFDEEVVLAQAEDKEAFYLKGILPAKLDADLLYCENIRLWNDQKIIFQTVAGVLTRLWRHTASGQDRSQEPSKSRKPGQSSRPAASQGAAAPPVRSTGPSV